MFKRIKSFFRGDDGAVTVDWVVLTAAVVAMAGVVMTTIHDSTGGVGSGVENFLNNKEID